MGQRGEDGRIPANKLLQAVVLILFSNLLLIGNNYVVAWTKLTSPEIVLVRGVFQVIIFVFLVCRDKEAKESGNILHKLRKGGIVFRVFFH